jgi:4-hydroxy-tetrahydrodipicolinate synthase
MGQPAAGVLQRLRGSLVPLVTPFRSGEIDVAALDGLIEFQIENGSHGLGVTGTTGEPSSLTYEEREFMIAHALERIRGRVPLLAGTGSANFDETLRLTRFAAARGADAVLVITPYYVRPNQENLYQYFRAISLAVPETPVVLYNIPGRTAVQVEPETIARLRRDVPNIVGVKHSVKDIDVVSQTLRLAGRDFLVYCGMETLTYPMLTLGGAGHISATGMVAPREIADLYNLAEAGRWDEARDLHYRMLELNDILFIEVNPVPLKTALALMDLCEREWRLPLGPMLPANEARLRETLARYGIGEGSDRRAVEGVPA